MQTAVFVLSIASKRRNVKTLVAGDEWLSLGADPHPPATRLAVQPTATLPRSYIEPWGRFSNLSRNDCLKEGPGEWPSHHLGAHGVAWVAWVAWAICALIAT